MITEESSLMTKGSQEESEHSEGNGILSETLFTCKPEVLRGQGSKIQG